MLGAMTSFCIWLLVNEVEVEVGKDFYLRSTLKYYFLEIVSVSRIHGI